MINKLIAVLLSLVLLCFAFFGWIIHQNYRDYKYGQRIEISGSVWDGCTGHVTGERFLIMFSVNFDYCPTNVMKPLMLVNMGTTWVEGVYLDAK